jgi:hypothetical protein
MMMQGLLAMIDPFGLRNVARVARNGIEAFKAFFGMPSRLMMEMGGHVANGFALGIDGQGRAPHAPPGAGDRGGRCRGAVAVARAGHAGHGQPARSIRPCPNHHPRPRRARHGCR